jgi:predicted transposase/invertase (TIGR01784 family)
MSLSEQWRSVMLDRQNNRMALRGQERQRQIDLAEALKKALTEGQTQGLAQGKAEGTAEKTLEIARRMKKAGRPFSEIAEFTDLPLGTVQEL